MPLDTAGRYGVFYEDGVHLGLSFDIIQVEIDQNHANKPEVKFTQRIADLAEESVQIVKEDLKVDDILLDYPVITHPCESAAKNQLAVYNFAQRSTQLILLVGVRILKSVHHSYPDKLQDMLGNQDKSLSSLLIIGEVRNEPKLLCL